MFKKQERHQQEEQKIIAVAFVWEIRALTLKGAALGEQSAVTQRETARGNIVETGNREGKPGEQQSGMRQRGKVRGRERWWERAPGRNSEGGETEERWKRRWRGREERKKERGYDCTVRGYAGTFTFLTSLHFEVSTAQWQDSLGQSLHPGNKGEWDESPPSLIFRSVLTGLSRLNGSHSSEQEVWRWLGAWIESVPVSVPRRRLSPGVCSSEKEACHLHSCRSKAVTPDMDPSKAAGPHILARTMINL